MKRLFHGALTGIAAIGLMAATASTTVQAAPIADVVILVDESGSMDTEHAWIGGMVSSLDAALSSNGISAQYALTGFGGHVAGEVAHKHTVGSGDFGTAAELGTAAVGLVTSGGTEDGWQAIDFALNNYTFRAGAAVNFILITDEPRVNVNGNSLTKAGVTSALTSAGILLNAVVNSGFDDNTPYSSADALGIDSDGNAYTADGGGGYTASATGSAAITSSYASYVEIALDTGGAGWDLNKLRAGGLTADSFTAAFVDIKVEEITEQVPLPGTLGMMLLGITGLAVAARRRRR